MEPAKSDSLAPGRSYALTNPLEGSSKAFLQVKLTDSFLKSLEQVRTVKSKDKRLRISFVSESGGVINFGQGDNAERYRFTVSTMDQQGSVECVFDECRNKQLSVFGSVSHKMIICGRDDSYEMTKTAMVDAKIEKEKSKVQEIELGQKGGARRQNRQGQLKTSLSHRKLGGVARNGGVIAPTKTSTSINKSLRSRIIHLLALKPCNKLELDAKLGKDGRGPQNLSGTLSQVADFKDNKFHLKKCLYSEVKIDTWPSYSEEDKRLIRKKLSTLETLMTSTTSSHTMHPPKETSLPSMGLTRSKLSPFKAVNSRIQHQQQRNQKEKEQQVTEQKERIKQHQQQRNQKEKEQQVTEQKERIKQHKPGGSTGQATVRKRSSSSLVSGSSEKKKMKPNGLDSSVSANLSSPHGPIHSVKSLECSPPRETAADMITKDQCESEGKGISVSTDSLLPDYEREYTKITSEEMRSRYKTDFNAEYPKYQQLQRLLDPFQNRFRKLAKKLNCFQQDSPGYRKLEKKIEQECEKWENDEHMQKVQQERDALYAKLSYIKQLVVQYDLNHC